MPDPILTLLLTLLSVLFFLLIALAYLSRERLRSSRRPRS